MLKPEESLGETPAFFSLTLIAAVLASACILWPRVVSRSHVMARAFYVSSAVISFAALLWILLGSFGLLPQGNESPLLLRILIYRGWMVIGTGLSSTLMIIVALAVGTKSPINKAACSFITSPFVLRGLCLSVSVSFICTEIGKIAHDAEMRQFFLQSGYAVWFLYFIIVAETLGATCLLFSRTMLAAGFALTLIMIGAISTHLHNRDPFSDSLEALHLLILLACIVLIRLLGERARARPHEAKVAYRE